MDISARVLQQANSEPDSDTFKIVRKMINDISEEQAFRLDDESVKSFGVGFDFSMIVTDTQGHEHMVKNFDSPISITVQLTLEQASKIPDPSKLKMC